MICLRLERQANRPSCARDAASAGQASMKIIAADAIKAMRSMRVKPVALRCGGEAERGRRAFRYNVVRIELCPSSMELRGP